MENNPHPTWLEVNLSALEHNTRYIMSNMKVPLMAVLKADGYGIGAVEAANAFLRAGAISFAVARFGEARQLRQAGIQEPILVLGMVTPQEVDEAINLGVWLNLYSKEVADMFAQRSRTMGKPVQAHFKVDTGMGRLGVLWTEAVEFLKYVQKQEGIVLEGVFSHLATSDTSDDHPLVPVQVERFRQAVDALAEAGFRPRWVHLANSSGVMCYPDTHFNMARVGTALYGIFYQSKVPFPQGIRRVFQWKARLATAKHLPPGYGVGYDQVYHTEGDEIVGTIPVGHVDGLRRVPGNVVLIGGERVPVVGKICMDQAMIRLPRLYPMGEEIVILGQQGVESIWVEELSKRWGCTDVNAVSMIHHRVPRVYVRD